MKKRFFNVFLILIILLQTSIGTANASQRPTVTRLAGYDRYETAFQIAKTGWQQSDYAVLAYGENYPDALAAVPLAGKLNAPILLTDKDSLNPKTRTALQDLKVMTVYVVGGTAVVSVNIENQLINAGYSVKRIAGQDKYDTAIKIAEELGDVSEVAVTTGDDYADALSIGAIAAQKQMPIILVPKDYITSSIHSYISSKNITKTYVVGDQSLISDNVVNNFNNPERILGQNKYARNIAILNRFTDSYQLDKLCLATGENFADALAGAVYAAKNKGAVALVKSDLPVSTNDFLKEKAIFLTNITVFGGVAVVPPSLIAGVFDETEDNLDYGFIDGLTYTNKYFGLTLTIPEKWIIEDITTDVSNDINLLDISKKSRNNNISKFQITATKTNVKDDFFTTDDILDLLNAQDETMKVVAIKEHVKKIGGIDFNVVELEIRLYDILSFHLSGSYANINGYNLMFYGYYINSDTELNQIFSSIQFVQ